MVISQKIRIFSTLNEVLAKKHGLYGLRVYVGIILRESVS